MFILHYVSYITCNVSRVMCHVSPVMCHLSLVKKNYNIFFIFYSALKYWTKGWSQLVEGLLSTGPTLSSYRYRYSVTLKNLDKIKHIRIVQKVCQMLSQNFIKHFHNEKNSLFLACLIFFPVF